MDKIKILVTGGNGQLGKCMLDILSASDKNCFSYDITTRAELDIKNPLAVERRLKDGQYNYLINCAAYTDVPGAEENEELALLGNSYGPKVLAEECAKANVKLVHISTDYVFDGTPSVKTEKSPTNPLNRYGRTKLLGEQEIISVAEKSNLEYMIIRTSWLYSEYGKNFVKTIINKLENDTGEIKVVVDQIGSPTYARDLANFIFTNVICRDLDGEPFISGVFHYSNDGSISWYDFAQMIARLYYSDSFSLYYTNQHRIVPCKTEDFPSQVNRPQIGILSKEKVKNTFDTTIRNWIVSLNSAIDKIQYNKKHSIEV